MSLYNKYRPQKFSEVSGQEHIKTTLLGALKSGEINHAYLFAGPRGTGKTSVARILSKALVCQEPKDGEPCNKCQFCKEITGGGAIDVLEIDAASNRGIDEIRELRENIKFSPNLFKYKIYIVDEVHMLTKEAFNALLKTLEEPPAHVIFILATTEAHRVPLTIISRCQRFDFFKLKPAELKERMKFIAKEEKLSIEEGALGLIIELSQGSLRDAISFLEQVAAFSGKSDIKAEDVEKVCGIGQDKVILDFISALSTRDLNLALSSIDEVSKTNTNYSWFISKALEELRKLLFLKTGILEKKDVSLESLKLETEEILFLIDNLSRIEAEMKFSSLPRLPLEILAIEFINKKNQGSSSARLADGEPRQVNSKPAVKIDKLGLDWSSFLTELKKSNPSLYTYLLESVILSRDKERVVLGFLNKFFLDKIMEPKNRLFLEERIKELTGEDLKLFGKIINAESYKESKGKEINSNDLIKVFGGKVVE